jgi:hypothetical protein
MVNVVTVGEDKNVAVELFGMRPIVSSEEYLDSIKKYLTDIVLNDRLTLSNSNLINEEYIEFFDDGNEPMTSFISMINLDVTNKLNMVMANSTDQIGIFSNYNPLCEGFVMTDIKINTYRSLQNENHFYNNVVFSAFNTTRYNTVSFKAEVFQDSSKIIDQWNKSVREFSSGTINDNSNLTTDLYIYNLSLLNNTTFNNSLFNNNYPSDQRADLFLKDNSLSNTTYDLYGNELMNGKVTIVDNGPDNIENLIKDLGF